MVGLIESIARDSAPRPQRQRGHAGPARRPRTTSTSRRRTRSIPANDFGTPTGGLLDTVRYPTTPRLGRDLRLRARQHLRGGEGGARRAHPARGRHHVAALVRRRCRRRARCRSRAASRHRTPSSYDFRVEWATGLQPPLYPTDRRVARRVAAAADCTRPSTACSARSTWPTSPTRCPDGGAGAPVDPRPVGPTRSASPCGSASSSPRTAATATACTGEQQKQVFVHDDPELVPGLSRTACRAASTASPVVRRPRREARATSLIVATDDGFVHAYRPERLGDPRLAGAHRGAELLADASRARHGPLGIRPPDAAIGQGAPVVADLDGDGQLEVVVTDIDGNVWAWEHDGTPASRLRADRPIGGRRRIAGAHQSDLLGRRPGARQERVQPHQAGHRRRRPRPAISTATVASRSSSAALDRHVYAWHDDGTHGRRLPRAGRRSRRRWRRSRRSRSYVTFNSDAGAREGGELLATPTLGDLDRRRPSRDRRRRAGGVRRAGQHRLRRRRARRCCRRAGTLGNARLYAISPDGTNASNPAHVSRRIPTSRPTSRDGRSRSACCNSSRCRRSATACRRQPRSAT